MRFLSVMVGCLAAAAMAAGCGSGSGGGGRVVTVKGSDTMVILGQRWAEAYMHDKPGSSIQVTGGGSGTGIAALINGATEICQSSRPMSEKERAQVRARRGTDVIEIPVALDGVAIYVHSSSRLQALSIAQLRLIYTGRVTNWREVGGPDARIVVYSRENNSGTYVFFKEHVLGSEDFARDVQMLPGTAAVVNAVGKDPASIGYGGIAYMSGIRSLPIAPASGAPVEASLTNVQSGAYPLARKLFFYRVGESSGEATAFIDWVLGDQGQKICQQVGYYPLLRQ